MSYIFQFDRLHKVIEDTERSVLFTNVCGCMDEPMIITVLGASGQGKSTLLRVLARLDSFDEGDMTLRNKSYREWSVREWRMKVGYVSQFPVMLPGSVEDNLKTVSSLHRIPFDHALAKKLMESLRLDHLDWNKKAADLSGGEKQRLSLIRSMLIRSEILLLDEITASLDQHSKHAVEQVLEEWSRREGVGMIWVTHDLQQARHHSKRVWFMAEGTLLEDRDTQAFFDKPDTNAGMQYLQGLKAEGEHHV